MLEIGTYVELRGYPGRVIANSNESHYGFCPAGMVIVRTPGGDTMATVDECKADTSWSNE